jgi:hypothetical protein
MQALDIRKLANAFVVEATPLAAAYGAQRSHDQA